MKDWKKIAVKSDTTMRHALEVIDKGAIQIALVVDDSCHLRGTVTDGDIRRAILRGEGLETPVSKFMNPNPFTGLVDEDPAIWQRTMMRHNLRHLPVLSAEGCVVELVRFRTPQEPDRDNLVILMAGGIGSRLRPLTQTTPKPLLNVGGKPILETIIENFVVQGFHRFVISINYLGWMIREHFGDGSRFGAQIEYVEETTRLGTAGALSLLREVPSQPFFVMNGDLLTTVDFVRLLEFHQKQEAEATLCVRQYEYQVPYGVTELEGHRLMRLSEKPIYRYSVNAGIYVLNPSVLSFIPQGEYFDMTSLFERVLEEKHTAAAFPLREYWTDVGRMDDFEQARRDFPDHFVE